MSVFGRHILALAKNDGKAFDLNMMPSQTPKFSATELHGKSVEFKITQNGKLIQNTGKLRATQDASGLKVALFFAEINHQTGQILGTSLVLTSDDLTKLSKNPPGSKIEYSLNAA